MKEGVTPEKTKRTCPTCHELVEWVGIASKPWRRRTQIYKTNPISHFSIEDRTSKIYPQGIENYKTNPNLTDLSRRSAAKTDVQTNPI
jgi:hypothetical protein